MSRTRSSSLLALAGIALLVCGSLSAQEAQRAPEDIFEAMTVKLLRGVVNVITCPVELPRQIDRQIRSRGAWEGSCVGLVSGVGMTAFRAVAGAVEAATFITPVPGFYDPVITPAYAWDNWPGSAPQ